MSGHSKWHSIKHKKGAADAKRSKIFTRHANLITIAARQGGDPEMNPTLRLAIDNAKKENVPNSNIEKSIKRGTGELKEGNELTEITYEGYGPVGTAIIVECLTDNKNRTYTNIRTTFNKRGGNLGGTGNVAWMFNRKGIITIQTNNGLTEELELIAIEAGAEDIKLEGTLVEVSTSSSEINEVTEFLKKHNINIENAEVQMIAKDEVKIESAEEAKKVLDFIDAIEEDPDVINVYSNFDISDEIMEKISE